MTSDRSAPGARLARRNDHRLQGSPDIDQPTPERELSAVREGPRVAGEEVGVHGDRLDELLGMRHPGNLDRHHFASLLPLPLIDTDAAGRIGRANAAAAVRLDVSLARLIGKPLTDFVREEDHPTLRSALRQATADPSLVRVVLRPHRSPSVAADCVVSSDPEADEAVSVQWTVLVGRSNPAAGTAPGPLVLAAAVAAISHLPAGETDVGSLLTQFARAAAAALDEATSISINLGRPTGPTHVAATSQEATGADGLQVRAGEGPCVLAYDERDSVLVDDLRTECRWPLLQALALESPVRSVLAVPVVAGGTRVGVLNSYSTVRHAFSDDHAQVADVLAIAAGAALDAVHETAELRRRADQLNGALESRAVIDQAKGIVMARRGCTPEEAFTHLADLSQQRNVKVRELARQMVEQIGSGAPDGRLPRSSWR